MTKNIKKTENNIRQKMQEMLHKEDGFSFIEVIIVMAMILVLTAILIPNYLGFVETAREANVKMSAQNMYTAVQMANMRIDIFENTDDLYLELKELNPSLIGIGGIYEDGSLYLAEIFDANTDVDDESVLADYGVLAENTCVVSSISYGDNSTGFTFEYYQLLNGKLYCVYFKNGRLESVESFNGADISVEFGTPDSSFGDDPFGG